MGVLNSAGPYITCQYQDYSSADDVCIPMSSQQFAQVTSIFSVGGLIGSFLAGKLADAKGRKFTSLFNTAGFVIGSLILIYSTNVHLFSVGRLILGISSGSSIVFTSLMITEIAPSHMIDSLGTFNQSFINIGILIVQSLSIKYAKALIWKRLFIVSFVFSVMQFALSVVFFIKDFKYITTDDNDLELSDHPKQVIGWKEYLTNSKYKKSAMFVALILIGQQFCGINAIILYSTQVISDLSSKDQADLPTQVNFVISILYLLIIFVIAFIICFALGVGPIPFAIISDLNPSEARTVSQSYGTVINWIGTILVSYSFPILAEMLGMSTVFCMFALFSVFFGLFIYSKLPTKANQVEETEALLN
ncbi:unnamed protein product [Hanseniaspora opuntiae]